MAQTAFFKGLGACQEARAIITEQIARFYRQIGNSALSLPIRTLDQRGPASANQGDQRDPGDDSDHA